MAEWSNSKAPDSRISCRRMMEHSGPRMWAWVQIPLLTSFQNFSSSEKYQPSLTVEISVLSKVTAKRNTLNSILSSFISSGRGSFTIMSLHSAEKFIVKLRSIKLEQYLILKFH